MKTMKEANEEVLRFDLNDRDWKGASVVVEIKDGKNNWYGSMHSLKVKDGSRSLYLCVGHFNAKATARKMVEDLQSGKITLAQAIEKSLKSYERWVAKLGTGKYAGGMNGIGREQLIYFGGTPEQVARLDRAEAAFTAYVMRKNGAA
jgi:hypothetical protein